jgi:glycine/D-amino acid oxidase-like deaminating enzyme/nitrite reductase/ring-hydroxylating ferredoxin subunit
MANRYPERYQTRSPWLDGATLPETEPLSASSAADVCVVGAGMAGLSCAYALARQGARVIVLERGRIGGRQTPQTTAHLASALDDRYYALAKLFGEGGARLAAESHAAAIDFIEEVVEREGIDCGFQRVDGYLFAGPGRPTDELDREADAAARAGISVALVERVPFPATFETGRAIRFARQGEFHPVRYLAGLAAAAGRLGVQIYAPTTVVQVEDGETVRVITDDGLTVSAAAAVVATNSPIVDRFALHTRQAPYTTYVIAVEIERGTVPPLLAYDTLDPYHYLRIYSPAESTADLLIVGGEDEKTGKHDDGEERFATLERWTRERFPMARAVRNRWSGQIYEPNDSLAFIGRNPHAKQVYVVTGDSGNGLTHGTIAAMILPDLIAGRPNPWSALYEPGRLTLKSSVIGEFIRENADVVVQMAENLAPGEVAGVAHIAPGRGALVRNERGHCAVYRDTDGVLHARDAHCTHLGCVVHWNSTEREWNCPCHGSRFDAYGVVVNGPAVRNLKPVDVNAIASA